MLVCDEGTWKVWLNDKDSGLTCWISGSSVADVLRKADGVCGGDDADWRSAKGAGGNKRR
jgi:hypothetical protein